MKRSRPTAVPMGGSDGDEAFIFPRSKSAKTPLLFEWSPMASPLAHRHYPVARQHVAWLCVLFILSATLAEAQQFGSGTGGSGDTPSSPLEAMPFDKGGTSPRCWNATGLQELTEDSGHRTYQAADMTLQEDCPPGTQLAVKVIDIVVGDNGPSARRRERLKQRLTAHGWEVDREHNFQILITGTWVDNLDNSESLNAAMVVQLCEVGMNAQCIPTIPLLTNDDNDSEHGIEAASPFTRRQLQVDDTGGIDVLGNRFEFAFATIVPDAGGAFSGQLTLRGAPVGTYSLLGSLVVYDQNLHFRGASIIPMGSPKEQLITFLDDLDTNDEEPASVKDWAVRLVISLSAIGGAIVFYLLIQFLRLHKAQIFELTQGKFIVAMLLSGLIATSSLVLLEPKNDVYCRLFQPLITLPMHVMFAILVGRMWRIRAIISPLLLLTLEKREHWTTRWVNIVEQITRAERFKRDKKIRRTITDGQLMRVIGLLCVPQIIVQILILTTQDQAKTIEYVPNQEESQYLQTYTAYETCEYNFFNNGLGITSFVLVLGLFVILMVLAGASRDMPSLFNETKSLLSVALNAFRMSIAATILLVATYTSPSASTAQFLVFSFLSGVTIVNTCIRITWPKFEVARSGSKIVVTKLIAAHNQARKSVASQDISTLGLGNRYSYTPSLYGGKTVVSGLSPLTTSPGGTPTSSKQSCEDLRSSAAANLPFSFGALDPSTAPLSEGNGPTKMATLQEEDGDEYSVNLRPAGSNESQQEEQQVEEVESDEEEETENLSTDSSVIMMEEESRDSLSGGLRGSTLHTRSTIDYNRHNPLLNFISNRSLNTAATNRVSGPYNPTSFASFARTNSEVSVASRFAGSIAIASPANMSPMADGRSRYSRVLSRRAMFQGQASRVGTSPDIENRSAIPTHQAPPAPPPPPPLSTPPSGPGQTSSWVPKSGTGRMRSLRPNLPWRPGGGERSNIGVSKKIFNLSFLGGGMGGGGRMETGSSFASDGAPLAIPLTIEYNPKHADEKIRVSENEPPPRRLLLRMIDVQRMLAKVNEAILTGLCVDPGDWEEIQDACVALGDVFTKEVEFEWQSYRVTSEHRMSDESLVPEFSTRGSMFQEVPNSRISGSTANSRISGSTANSRISGSTANSGRSFGRGLTPRKQLSWKPGLVTDSPSDDGHAPPSTVRNTTSSTSNMDSSESGGSSVKLETEELEAKELAKSDKNELRRGPKNRRSEEVAAADGRPKRRQHGSSGLSSPAKEETRKLAKSGGDSVKSASVSLDEVPAAISRPKRRQFDSTGLSSLPVPSRRWSESSINSDNPESIGEQDVFLDVDTVTADSEESSTLESSSSRFDLKPANFMQMLGQEPPPDGDSDSMQDG